MTYQAEDRFLNRNSAKQGITFLSITAVKSDTLKAEWNLSAGIRSLIVRRLRQEWTQIKLQLRLYKMPKVRLPFEESAAVHHADFPLNGSSSSCLLAVESGAVYMADLGCTGPAGSFIPQARSQLIFTEPVSPLSETDLHIFSILDANMEPDRYSLFDGYGLTYDNSLTLCSDLIELGRAYREPDHIQINSAITADVPVWQTRLVLPGQSLPGTRVLMLSWEFPPNTVGGLAAAVEGLSRELAGLGVEVHVLTCSAADLPACEKREGVYLHRASILQSVEPLDFMEWVGQMNAAFIRTAETLTAQGLMFDLIHAHDWLTGSAASILKQLWNVPLAATIHSTESGRTLQPPHFRQGSPIQETENVLMYEAEAVIVCSRYMEEQVTAQSRIAASKVFRIPNGVHPASISGIPGNKSLEIDASNERLPYGERDDVPGSTQFPGGEIQHVLFLGRLVYEKGIQYLLRAWPALLSRFPRAELTIAGRGPYEPQLRELAASLGLAGRVRFAGFAGPAERAALLAAADAVAVPSLYEPFGLAALEAMAAGRPLVACASGGLPELVEHGVDGLLAQPHSAEALAAALAAVLGDGALAARLGAAGRRKARRFGWAEAAVATAAVYARLLRRERS
ncbi:glycosyltransferase [Paenibacillus gansuensis]|uniref:Glycosyltransferase n=1 Tax=Paenibacillus gansuensis TaxID=306542 RepID=A0ABW5P941_9BACL